MESGTHAPNTESNNIGLRELKHPIARYPQSSKNKRGKVRTQFILLFSSMAFGERKDGMGGGTVIGNNHKLSIFWNVQPSLGGFMNI